MNSVIVYITSSNFTLRQLWWRNASSMTSNFERELNCNSTARKLIRSRLTRYKSGSDMLRKQIKANRQLNYKHRRHQRQDRDIIHSQRAVAP